MERREYQLLLLTLAGGGVDAIMISAFNVLTAAQTGNTILFAVAIAHGQFSLGFSAAVSVFAFVVGVGLAELLFLRKSRIPDSNGLGGIFAFELVMLIALLALWHLVVPAVPVLVGFAALAMGVQSGVVKRLHNGPTTTYITGVLTSFMAGLVQSIGTGSKKGSAAENSASFDKKSGTCSPWSYGLVWVTYALGAIVSGLLFLRAGEWALLLPIACVGVVILCNPRKW